MAFGLSFGSPAGLFAGLFRTFRQLFGIFWCLFRVPFPDLIFGGFLAIFGPPGPPFWGPGPAFSAPFFQCSFAVYFGPDWDGCGVDPLVREKLALVRGIQEGVLEKKGFRKGSKIPLSRVGVRKTETA